VSGFFGVLKADDPGSGGHLAGEAQRRDMQGSVRAGGDGLVSHAGSALLAGLADQLGLTGARSRADGIVQARAH
jgi:hypothetical protein